MMRRTDKGFKGKFKAMIYALSVIMLSLALLSGCLENQPSGRGDNDMEEARIQDIVDRMISGEMTDEEFSQLDIDTMNAAMRRVSAMFPPSDEQREIWRLEDEEWFRTNLTYIFGNPAQGRINPSTEGAEQADLQTIERFVFASGSFHFGVGLVIDILHGRVYFNPHAGSGGFGIFRLDSTSHSHAEFKDYDLERLIRAIEESSLRDWPEYFRGDVDEHIIGGSGSWSVGIQFPDDVFLRRGGSGDRNSIPPEAQWRIFRDFIDTLGQEIMERHAAENPQADE